MRRAFAVWIAGSLGTALIVHANHIHYGNAAPTMSAGVLLFWLAVALAVTR